MSLLPEVERELLRAARSPLPDEAPDAGAGEGRSGRRMRRPDRPSASSISAVAAVLVALAVGAVFLSVLHHAGAMRTGSRAATGPTTQGVHGIARSGFPGAPRTQRDGDGVASWTCPLAAPSRYLPPRSGCVTVGLADLTGNGHADLILVYSRLSGSAIRQSGPSTGSGKLYQAEAAFLKVVLPDGHSVAARIRGARAAALVGLGDVNRDRGEELFIEVSHISSGSTAVAYGFHDGQLIPAGVTLAYGGDSATKAGFDCLAGKPSRLVQRTYELDGPTIYAWWTETEVTYAWHGPRLVWIARRSFRRRGLPTAADSRIGAGCVTVRATTRATVVSNAAGTGLAQPGG